MTIAVRTDTPIKMEAKEGALIISGGQDITTREKEFTIADIGTLRNIGTSSEILTVVFNDIPLIFRKNSQGRYDLSSAEIEARTYNFRYEDGLPQLCILAQLNDRHEVLAFMDSTSGISQRRTDNVHHLEYRENDRPSYQATNISYPAHQYDPPRNIADRGSVIPRGIIAYVTHQNPSVDRARLSSLIDTYICEARDEGINHDIAIAQMLYWTDSLRNQGRVRSHNYGGLSTNGLRWDGSFNSMTEGVQAHIQHLKGYASSAPLNKARVDPRYQILVDLGYRGRVRTFDQLYRLWTANFVSYGNSIDRILNELYRFSENSRQW